MGCRLLLSATVLTLLSISSRSEVQSTSFMIVNNCRRTIWPALQENGATAQVTTTGFTLRSGESKNISIPNPWTGTIWARTHCGQNSSGKFTCLSGDCGSGELECNGGRFQGPTTLAEFSLNNVFDGLDFYDVSVVNGFNLPMLLTANAKTGACGTSGCLMDLNSACPKVLSVTSGDGREDGVVACRNACVIEDWRGPSPDLTTKCRRSLYALFFKSACPRAYIYALDDRRTLTCRSANYTITFCPLPSTGKSND